MESNVEMTREYQLNGITVIQRTEDAYFDLNALIHEYNDKRGTKYKLTNFFELPSVKRAMNTIYRKEVVQKDFSYNLLEINVSQKICPSLNDNDTLSEKISNNGNINKLAEKYCKKKTKGKRGGLNGGGTIDKVFCHPHLFVKCCMWLDEDFDYEATKMVYDNLIQLRIEVCDNDKPFNDWIFDRFGKNKFNISNVKIALNKAVFGYNDSEINQRNYATVKQLEQLKYYQRLIQDLTLAGFFNSIKDVTQYLKKEQEKNFPIIPIQN